MTKSGLEAGDFLCLLIEADEVSPPMIGRAVDVLMDVSEDPAKARKYAQTLLVAFEGYERLPQEIYEIEDCRQYLQALTDAWPYWMHFLAPLPDQWAMVLRALLPASPDQQEISSLLDRLASAMFALHRQIGLPESESTKTVEEAIRAVGLALKGC